jgi:hypothetical protein
VGPAELEPATSWFVVAEAILALILLIGTESVFSDAATRAALDRILPF